MMVFCTLFDSNYLDKGLAMYRSLVSVNCSFKIYVLAMDDKCEEILKAYRYENLTVIHLERFVIESKLSEVREKRSRAEFCWTCTPFLIDYVITKFSEPICTYIDADLYFYRDPQCLIDEMKDKTVQIVEHRYNPTWAGKLLRTHSGTYCVEFNTFTDKPDSMRLLKWWKKRCFESCSSDIGKSRRIGLRSVSILGDQCYLENWGSKKNVSVLKHLGGGVAPWNIAQYRLLSNKNTILLTEKRTGKKFPLVFYHYHNISYYDAHKVSSGVLEPWLADRRLTDCLYKEYLRRLDAIKNELKDRFDIYPLLRSHPAYSGRESVRKKPIEYLRSIDILLIPRIYVKLIGNKKAEKYSYLNIIEF